MLSAALAGCGNARPADPPVPVWVDLMAGFRPPPLQELARHLESLVEPPRPGRILPGKREKELWFELPLPRAGWTRSELAGAWRMPMPEGGALQAGESTTLAVLDGSDALKQGRPRLMRAGRFWTDGQDLFVTLEPEAEPSDELLLCMRLDAGHEVDGHWRVTQWDLACAGLLVFPGAPQTLALEIPPGSCLSFASVAPDPGGRGAELAPTTFRVLLDGAALFVHVQRHAHPSRAEFHSIPLAAAGRHTLTFEVEGPAPAVIATPLLAPAGLGTPGKRPWKDPRPDIVLVLCDTFRADNLAAWGGDPENAPHLNRFVERSLRFLDARSTAAWTLPSIASILSGLFPGQHGATDLDRGVSSEVETLAEILGREGYRTVAQTDSGLFSRHYGQDQGFQWFEEAMVKDWNLNATLARARQQMAADDGRPLFLVVHTYRVHGPMRVGPDEDPRPLQELRAELRERTLQRQASDAEVQKVEVALELLEQGVGLYADAVRDLDTKVGTWIEELEGDGFFERGHLVLTADHGNSHGEHQQIGHGGDLYDIKLRVPFAIAGQGITPRAVSGAASLIHLAPTLTALAGVAPSPTWVGRSLLDAPPAGPIYAFDLRKRNQQLALYSAERKVVGKDLEALRGGRALFAFDLQADPAEDHNLAEDAHWPGELQRALADSLEPYLHPLAEGQALELPPEVMEQLKAIGYGE